jgi:hypothetical protein
MTPAPEAHTVQLATREPVPVEAPVGGDVTVTLQAACPAGCDLRGLGLALTAPDGTETTANLASFAERASETAPITLRMPGRVGPHVWTVACPACERGRAHHPPTSLAFTITARPLTASLAIWSIPQPLVAGAHFALKVGVKSSAGCELAGQRVEICDAAGAVAARGVLGDTPWPGTTGLYWVDIAMNAPATPGLTSWSARFTGGDRGLPHAEAASSFELSTVAAPEHRLTVRVCEKATAAPVEDAIVRLGDFRAATDASGTAALELPEGRYKLSIWKSGYEAPETTIDVRADGTLEIEAMRLREEDPDAAWRA